ncbi:hypothetical protein OQA88_9564 [Cercophora sp. LCS_1]
MSARGGGRGGGRGGRGGRGGARGGSRSIMANSVPWDADPTLVLDSKPTELFPAYKVPRAPALNRKEDKQVAHFLLFREQLHDSPLYTKSRSFAKDARKPPKAYGQECKGFGHKTKADIDPFTAVPTYSKKFTRSERLLPSFESLPFNKQFFPPELHATLDGDDVPSGPAAKKRRTTGPKTLGLSNITSLKTAEELFHMDGHEAGVNGTGDINNAIRVIDTLEKRAENGEDDGFLSDEDDWTRHQGDEDGEGNFEEEDQYDDESGDDYDAEQYFDDGDNEDYDEGGGDDGGAEVF